MDKQNCKHVLIYPTAPANLILWNCGKWKHIIAGQFVEDRFHDLAMHQL